MISILYPDPVDEERDVFSLASAAWLVGKLITIVVFSAMMLGHSGSAWAQEDDQTPEVRMTQALFPARADYLLIAYSVRQESLAINDEIPLVRIYGDGRVHVHRPEYLKQSGDFQMYLTAQELQNLCLELMRKNVMSYQDKRVEAEIADAERSANMSYIVSDDVHSSIELNLHAVKISSRNSAEPVAKRRHVISNIRAKTQNFPEIQELADFADIEQQLNQIVYHPKLQVIR